MKLNTDSEFCSYHMKCINGFRWTNLSRSVICKDSTSGFFIKPSPFLSQLVFFAYFINTFGKLLFLLFLITDQFGPIEFLDRICGMDYLLCGSMVCLSYVIWQRYPLYEIIYRLWEVENRIYLCLGNPREIKWAAEERHSVTLWAHVLLTCLGCCSLTIQFYMDPKYCVFTYSMIETDNPYLRILFCSHEVLFLSHAWFAMACSNGLCSFEAVNLSNIIKQMSKAVNELTRVGKFTTRLSPDPAEGHDNNGRETEREYKKKMGDDDDDVDDEGRADRNGKEESTLAFQYNDSPMTGGLNQRNGISSRHFKGIPEDGFRNGGKLLYSATGHYSFRKILYDYQQLMLISEQFNAWIGYKIVALSIIAFCQYISSTTMAFQVLRMPGTGIGDIWFYIQDCMVATYVTFRVFDYMSIVLPSAEGFFCSVRRYQSMTGSVGKHLQKFIKTLRPVSLKIGPNPTRRETVLSTMDMLTNYYVCVALW